MRCPTLSELPPPPPGKTGWPWTEESPQLPDTMLDGSPWPRVSIVTPSLNQGQFIEETIRSVLLQGYPDLEYIIIDGGSTDGSVDIIRKYEPWLAYWVSEPDRGQADAINKGFRMARGEIVAWLNSDDIYYPGTIEVAVRFLASYPDLAMVYSDSQDIGTVGEFLSYRKAKPFDLATLLREGNYIPQPTVFLRRGVLKRVGLLDDTLHMVFDYDMWLRIGMQHEVAHLLEGQLLAGMRRHSGAKTSIQHRLFPQECVRIMDKLLNCVDSKDMREVILWGRARFCYRSFYEECVTGNLHAALIWLTRAFRHSPRYALGRPPWKYFRYVSVFSKAAIKATLSRYAWRG